MAKVKRKIAVLTSGGDSAGMNALVRSVVKYGIIRCVVFALPIDRDEANVRL